MMHRHDSVQGSASSAEVISLFDAKSSSWSTRYEVGGRLRGRLEAFLDLYREHTIGSEVRLIIDLGCGTGEVGQTLAASEGGTVLAVGVDASAGMLTKGPGRTNGPMVRADLLADSLPFASCVADAVVVSSVVEYLPDENDLLQEVHRILRPGGLLLISYPDRNAAVRRVEKVVGNLLLACPISLPGRLKSYASYLRASANRPSVERALVRLGRAGLVVLRPPARRSSMVIFACERPGPSGSRFKDLGCDSDGRAI